MGTGQMSAFNATLSAPDINDPEGYSKFIEVNSWVDQNIVNAFMWNVDAFALSAYLHKDRNGKVAYGPLWDFDRAAESLDERDDSPEVWRFFFNQNWWNKLRNDPGFWQLYADRWYEWRQSVLSDETIDFLVDGFADETREAAVRNFDRWRQVAPRRSSVYESGQLDGTYQGEVEHLRHWLHARLAFMDSVFTGAPEVLLNESVLPYRSGVVVSHQDNVTILSDPQIQFDDTVLVSGTPGATTATYLVPTNDDLGDTWTQPTFDDVLWERGPTGIGTDSGNDFTDLIRTVVDPREKEATSIFTRIEFSVSDLQNVLDQELVLRLKYDDGFVAYLNGQEIARDGIENELSWNAPGGSSRSDQLNEEFHDIDISDKKDLLIEGRNLLAIRVVNARASSGDILIVPELVARTSFIGRSPTAQVYYTLDGSDPRAPDGSPSPSAILVTPETKLKFEKNTRVTVRNLDEIARNEESEIVVTNWSGLVQHDFVVASPSVAISEIHYNPANPTATEAADIPDADSDGRPDWTSDDFEFVEIHNPTLEAADLATTQLVDGVRFDFLTSEPLAAESYGLIVANQAAFELRYGSDLPVIGQFEGNLNNNGERVQWTDGTGATLFSVSYGDNDPWPIRSDGLGASLELIDSSAASDRQNKYYSWVASAENGGSPGRAYRPGPGIVINEVLTKSQGRNDLEDAVELYNSTDAEINVGGWYLSDSSNNFQKYEIPEGTTLAAGEYRVFQQTALGFRLNGDVGDDVWLTISDADGNVTTFVNDVHFGSSINGESFARIPNASGRLAPAAERTLGNENSTARVGPLVITEINYNPGAPSAEAMAIDSHLVESDLEFIEVHNPTDSKVDLTDWRLRGGIDFEFDPDLILEANASVVVVTFHPFRAENANRVAGFRAHYGIGPEVEIVGGFAGQLNNGYDQIRLLRPQAAPDDRPNFVPRTQEDEVLYDDLAPWPILADGIGASLHRVSPAAYGNDAASWIAAQPNPGSLSMEIRGDFDGSGIVDAADINLLFLQLRSARPDLSFDLTSDGLVNEMDRDQLVENIIGTSYGDSNLDRIFNSTDLVEIFRLAEYEDGIPGNSRWESGDWNGDGDFSSSDLVLAFIRGGFSEASVKAVLPTDTAGALDAFADPDSNVDRNEQHPNAGIEKADEALQLLELLAIDQTHRRIFESHERFNKQGNHPDDPGTFADSERLE